MLLCSKSQLFLSWQKYVTKKEQRQADPAARQVVSLVAASDRGRGCPMANGTPCRRFRRK